MLSRKCSRCSKIHSDKKKDGKLYSECSLCRDRTKKRHYTPGSGLANSEVYFFISVEHMRLFLIRMSSLVLRVLHDYL